MIEERKINLIRKNSKILFRFTSGINLIYNLENCNYDRLGSVRFLTDASGSIVQEYVYDAFGNLLSSSGSISQPYEFVGREGYYRESVFNLYLLGQRWYDSDVGRFISRDLIGEKGGINLYEYVRNNVVNLVDPEGAVVEGSRALACAFCLGSIEFGLFIQYFCRSGCEIFSKDPCVRYGDLKGQAAYEKCVNDCVKESWSQAEEKTRGKTFVELMCTYCIFGTI